MDSTKNSYQVIARKYRPQTFSSVLGQDAIVTTLKNALHFNRLAHAYLFCGCRGTGKTTLARVFAKALNCSNLTDAFEPCNTCTSCLDIVSGRSLDVMEIDGASNRGIDDIRQINETIGYAPSSGKYKIYIIDEVHMLTKEAFNALLKTLEEPPANVKFFFATTEPHKVLPTIISRCQRFDLNRISFEALKKKLAWIAADLKIPCDEEVLSIVANVAEGSLRDAESLFDQIICYAEQPITAAKVLATLGILPRSAFFSLDKAFDEQNLTLAFELADDIFTSGKDLSYFIDNLIEHYRSLLKLKLNAPVVFPTTRLEQQYSSSTSLYTQEQCLYILDFLIHWQQQIGKTPFKRVSLEMILLHIIRSKYRLTLPSLVKRLQELEHKLPISESLPHQSLPIHPEKAIDAAPVFVPEKTQATLDTALGDDKVIEEKIESLPEQMQEMPAIKEQQGEIENIPAAALDATPTLSPQEIPQQTDSFEETLIKKIRENIESLPEKIQETPPQEYLVVEELPIPSRQSSLLFPKSKWEALASDEKIQTQSPSHSTETVVVQAITPAEEKTLDVAVFVEKISTAISQAPETQEAKPPSAVPQSRYDTLTRFAMVELEGILKKEQPNG